MTKDLAMNEAAEFAEVAIGGEIPGAWVFIAEHATDKRTGLAIGLVTSGLALGLFLGSLTAIGLNAAHSGTQDLLGIKNDRTS